MGRGACARCSDFLRGGVGIFFVEVYDAHDGTFLSKPLRDSASDAAGGAGYDGDFAIKAKPDRRLLGVSQRETPLFQGIKSSCESISAFVRASPLAT